MSTSRRGFASMSPARVREIAAKGGKAAHDKGVAHQWTKEEAAEMGSKGGTIAQANRRRAARKTA